MSERNDMPELPEPKYIWHDDGQSEDLFVFADSGAVDEGCPHCERLYTANQIQAMREQFIAYAEQRVREEREACAALCDAEAAFVKSDGHGNQAVAQNCAAAIRRRGQ